MLLGEITYTKQKKQSLSFKDLHLLRSNKTFSKSDQYATLCLKQSKIDVNHTELLIMLAATNFLCCPMQTFCCLFTYDSQSPYAPLFAYNNTSFIRCYTIKQLCQRLVIPNISSVNHSGHNFRHRIIQYVSNNGILDENTQKLGH